MTAKSRYITFHQGVLYGGQSKRLHYVAKKGTVLKGILITGKNAEVSLSINSRTEVFLAGQGGENATNIAPNKRLIRFDEPISETNIYGVIERKGAGQLYTIYDTGISVYLIIEER